MDVTYETYHGHNIIIKDGALTIDGVAYEYKGDALQAAYLIVEEIEGIR